MVRQTLPANVWEFRRHWSPGSEAYTGCDSLITALDNGWTMRHYLAVRQHQLGTRTKLTFHLLLEKDARLVKMVVIDNPVLRRTLTKAGLLPLRRLMNRQASGVDTEEDQALMS